MDDMILYFVQLVMGRRAGRERGRERGWGRPSYELLDQSSLVTYNIYNLLNIFACT